MRIETLVSASDDVVDCTSHCALDVIPGSVTLGAVLKYILSDTSKCGEIELHYNEKDIVCVYSNGRILGGDLGNELRDSTIQGINYLAMQNHRDFFISLNRRI